MKESLIDTDILSYYFRGNPEVVSRFNMYLDNFDRINISLITYFEILSGLLVKDSKGKLKMFESFCSTSTIINPTVLSASIAAQTVARLHKNGTIIGNQDILIAATAIENNLILVTNNEKHFSRIENLEIENWTKS